MQPYLQGIILSFAKSSGLVLAAITIPSGIGSFGFLILNLGPFGFFTLFSLLVLAYSLSGFNSSSESHPPSVECAIPYFLATTLNYPSSIASETIFFFISNGTLLYFILLLLLPRGINSIKSVT